MLIVHYAGAHATRMRNPQAERLSGKSILVAFSASITQKQLKKSLRSVLTFARFIERVSKWSQKHEQDFVVECTTTKGGAGLEQSQVYVQKMPPSYPRRRRVRYRQLSRPLHLLLDYFDSHFLKLSHIFLNI